MIFSILLYIIVAELVVSGRMLRMTGENDALLARMRNQIDYSLIEIEDMLLTDLAGQAAEEEAGAFGGALPTEGAGAAPPAGDGGGFGGMAGEGGEGGEGEEEAADPAAGCDSSRDSWAQPQSRAENDLTTYYWVEPENAKFNLLSLWSKNEEWARFSRDQLVRLIDVLREDTDFDVSISDAERIVSEIEDFAERQGTDGMPRPLLKSDEVERPQLSLPVHLDYLMLLPSVDEELFFDKVLDGRVIRGLESVLTVWTSLAMDPGDPEKNARIAARQAAEAESEGAADPAAATPPTESTPGGEDPEAPAELVGEGIRVNINFASRPVLRALFPVDKVPDLVIDAIIRWRNEEDPDAAEEDEDVSAYDFGELELGDQVQRRFFETTEDLEQIPEFENLPDPELKADFKRFTTTISEVFSVHLATLYLRNEENRAFVMRRARSVVVRLDDGADGVLYPIVRLEERNGLRVLAPDMQDEEPDLQFVYSEMDSFAQQDRAWNPFLVDFYMPQYQREQFYEQQDR
ncbi:MAG: hypothetical protein VYE77_07120 [Planctomycetota bacterium]|nr:hypothetical protein [Planctomycetota bacterium]